MERRKEKEAGSSVVCVFGRGHIYNLKKQHHQPSEEVVIKYQHEKGNCHVRPAETHGECCQGRLIGVEIADPVSVSGWKVIVDTGRDKGTVPEAPLLERQPGAQHPMGAKLPPSPPSRAVTQKGSRSLPDSSPLGRRV